MTIPDWIEGLPVSIMVCDRQGIILSMNEEAAAHYAEGGGRALIGQNVLDCHPEPARTRLAEILATGRTNVYTIEKGGARTLVYHTPWHVAGETRGIVEMLLPLPDALPHFIWD
ncbi:MAG: hypothetical protein Kow0077_14820 [Anaerolineae bacterium]